MENAQLIRLGLFCRGKSFTGNWHYGLVYVHENKDVHDRPSGIYINSMYSTESNFNQVMELSICVASNWQARNIYGRRCNIYSGDVIELLNDAGEKVRFVCEYGKFRRNVDGNECEMDGFYFREVPNGTIGRLPIVNNYKGCHDTELYTIIGNIIDNPELQTKNI
jgi:hypothetical protein